MWEVLVILYNNDEWIIEGVYYAWVQQSFDEADKAFEEANADTEPATDENGTPIEFTNCENTTDIPW